MSTSLRARLSLWNAAGFAVLLGGSGAGVYAFVATTVESRTDAYLAQTATALAEALAARPGTDAEEIVERFQLRDIGVAVFDATTGAVPALPRPLAATLHGAGRPAVPGSATPYPFGGPWGAAAAAPVAARAVRAGTVTATLGDGPSAERVAAVARTVPGSSGSRVLVAAASQSLGAQHAVLREAREALVAGVLLLLGVAGAGGYAVAWRSLHPIDAMSRRAARIEAGTLHERLPTTGQAAELARLAGAFNGLLARIEVAVAQQRQFMADASHELRTPVAIVRGEAELALAQPARSEAEYRTALTTVAAQAEALTRLVDDLFLLARAGAGERGAAHAPLYLEELAEQCVQAVRTLARARGVALGFVPDAELPVVGDVRLLRRALLNLLDNAIKYTPTGGSVRVAVARVDAAAAPVDGPVDVPVATPSTMPSTAPGTATLHPPADAPHGAPGDEPPGLALAHLLDARWTGEYRGVDPVVTADGDARPADVPADAARAGRVAAGPWARVIVSDTGPGIPPEAQPHVFDRFYRARRAASGPGDPTGAGLGLAIVAWVAAVHDGRVALVRSDAGGTVFAFDVPLAAAADEPGAADQAARRSTPAVSRSSSPPTSAVTSATITG